MRSARWMMWLILLGAHGCGGIAIVSGEPFVPDSGDVDATDASGLSITDLGRDATAMDATDAPDASDAPNASDTPDASDTFDAPAVDQLVVEPLDAPLFEVSRPEVSINDSAMALEVAAFVDALVRPDAGFPDAGFPDAGFPDAGFPDAGFPDAGFPDAGFPDAGFPDAGFFDARVPDVSVLDAAVVTEDLGVSCGLGMPLCNGLCVDLLSDPRHCGACNVSCPAPRTCVAGSCGVDGGPE